MSDVMTIDQVIADIRNRKAELANTLTALVENFAYDEMLIFVPCANHTHTNSRHCVF